VLKILDLVIADGRCLSESRYKPRSIRLERREGIL